MDKLSHKINNVSIIYSGYCHIFNIKADIHLVRDKILLKREYTISVKSTDYNNIKINWVGSVSIETPEQLEMLFKIDRYAKMAARTILKEAFGVIKDIEVEKVPVDLL
jgi:hypothetical protein